MQRREPCRFISLACYVTAAATLGAQTGPIFSEDFESGKVDRGVWGQRVDGVATLKVQQDQAAHGKYALQIHYPEMAARSCAFIVAPHLPDSLKTRFFGRAYVKIDPATPPSHTVLLVARTRLADIEIDEIGISRDAFQPPSYQENESGRGQGRGEDVKHAGPVPLGKWFLLEWEFNDNPATLTI